jgi:hypothetical protein
MKRESSFNQPAVPFAAFDLRSLVYQPENDAYN